ncbi:orotidine-5-phosphate decarboxylase [Archaeoglobus sulfaticallidus PM70-1]|uniref:Orotidine 5'-phosphate decarboxylase n=1 Tax=Archaeoglobus sulfaticallidus PM70-1 TaxID=387631 RepID=N0BD75_9EURY|nr:orotidine-5'-phosphate decarboxylase [Archaeoglobus sulfaticallidus]AGK60197.1 orotidine-5-phosphate decarboxylase [Archaeoglobus sulfaticallidus PM70-1]
MVGLILALDVMDRNRAIWLAREVSEYVDYLKVNYPLVLSAGIEIIRELSEIKPVIADFKIADIPYTSSLIARKAFENSAFAVICHGMAGSDTLKAVLDVSDEFGGEVYVVTELSSESEFLRKFSDEIAMLARDIGCHGIIAPATRAERVAQLRKIVGSMKILSPGVGAQGGSVEETIKAGADYIIVGRSIYTSDEPKAVARDIYERIKGLEV